MSIIEDLYNGAVYPAEQVRPRSPAFRAHRQEARRLWEQVEQSLTPEQRTLMDAYRDEEAVVLDLYDLEYFRAGIRFAVKLMAEALGTGEDLSESDK